jgi:hypothetical protein
MTYQREPQLPRNALAEDMIRKEKEAAHRKAERRYQREKARWFAPVFAVSLAVALFIVGYTMYRADHSKTTGLPTMSAPAQ